VGGGKEGGDGGQRVGFCRKKEGQGRREQNSGFLRGVILNQEKSSKRKRRSEKRTKGGACKRTKYVRDSLAREQSQCRKDKGGGDQKWGGIGEP